MVLGLFGESCTGKSTIADEIKKRMEVQIFSGKDYLRFAKNEEEARRLFIVFLESHETTDDLIIYITAEKEQLSLIPKKAVRILVTADLDTIKERFSKRMKGNLPGPVAAMLERNHGMFSNELYDLSINNTIETTSDSADKILSFLK